VSASPAVAPAARSPAPAFVSVPLQAVVTSPANAAAPAPVMNDRRDEPVSAVGKVGNGRSCWGFSGVTSFGTAPLWSLRLAKRGQDRLGNQTGIDVAILGRATLSENDRVSASLAVDVSLFDAVIRRTRNSVRVHQLREVLVALPAQLLIRQLKGSIPVLVNTGKNE